MNEQSYYLGVKSLSKRTTRSRSDEEVFFRVMQHNMRENVADIGIRKVSPIDASRTYLNISLYESGDSAAAVSEFAIQLIRAKVKKYASNAGLGIELIFSLPNDLEIDYVAFFRFATEWARRYFEVPLLSSIIHYDESTPHCHVILIPIVDDKLASSNVLGDKANTYKIQDDFYNDVAKKFGLAPHRSTSEKKPKQRFSKSTVRRLDSAIFEKLRSVYGISEEVLVALFKGDKMKLLALLDIQMPKGSFDGFVNELSMEKNKTSIGLSAKTPIGHFTAAETAKKCPENFDEKESPISVYRTFNEGTSVVPQVGEIWSDQKRSIETTTAGDPPPPITPAAKASPIVIEVHIPIEPENGALTIPDQYSRQSDNDNYLRDWNERIGEFVDRTVNKSAKRLVLDAVNTALMSLRFKKMNKVA
ncbi:MAG: plasmid recombination protein [Dehalococcoidales bacterium]|nr:plasmid recombination protein [Dehalococcoidales bacterium]